MLNPLNFLILQLLVTTVTSNYESVGQHVKGKVRRFHSRNYRNSKIGMASCCVKPYIFCLKISWNKRACLPTAKADQRGFKWSEPKTFFCRKTVSSSNLLLLILQFWNYFTGKWLFWHCRYCSSSHNMGQHLPRIYAFVSFYLIYQFFISVGFELGSSE